MRLYVRWGPSPLQKGDTVPQYSAHVCWYQTAGWIEILLGTEVGLGPGNIVSDCDTTPPPKKGHSPPMSVVAKRLDGLKCHMVWR